MIILKMLVICPEHESFSPQSAEQPTGMPDHTTFRRRDLIATFSQDTRYWKRESEGAEEGQATSGSTFQEAASFLEGGESISPSRGHLFVTHKKRQVFARSTPLCYTSQKTLRV